MKSLRIFGLVVLAALMAMAIVGNPSAMAEPTGLCATEADEENPCESVIEHVHETSVGTATLLTSLLAVECNVLFLGEVTEEGSPLMIQGSFTYTECGSCTVEEAGGPAVIEVLKEGHETASVSGSGEVHVQCGGFVDCYYAGEEVLGTAKGPLLSEQENGEISIQGQIVKKVKGFFCPETGKLDLRTTPLSPTHIVGRMRCEAVIRGDYKKSSANLRVCEEFVGFPNGFYNLVS